MNKWAIIKNGSVDKEGLPVKRTSEVIDELKKEGYLIYDERNKK